MTWDVTLARPVDPLAATAELPMDNEAFARFYERSARQLWAYLARTSRDPGLADDLMQESFVRFLGAGRPDDGEVASRKYLFRIGTNLLRDHWRRPRQSSIEDVPEEAFAVRSLEGEADNRAVLGRAMAGMKMRDRQLLWLAYGEDYTHKEIAEIMGLASASVRLLLFRARHVVAAELRALDAGRKS